MVKLSINLILNHPTVKSLQTPQLKIILLKKEKQKYLYFLGQKKVFSIVNKT